MLPVDGVTTRRDPVAEYARNVVDGITPAGRLVRLACERHLRDLEEGPARGLVWNLDAAEHAIAFYGFLRHSKGEWAGQPLTLELWQMFIVGSLHGWLRPELDAADEPTGKLVRRFRTAWNEIPRKNGKSTIAAGEALELLVADAEPGAEVYCAATKKDQARIVWEEAARMVKKSPALSKRIQVLKSNLNIPGTASKLEPLGADEDTLDGLNIHAAIVDEVHAHKTRGVVDVLETATGARRQPLIFYITTAGYDRTSVAWELHEYAIKVLSGVVDDDSFFAYIATCDDGDDWRDEATWAKANPNLGVSVKLDDLRRLCKKAEHSVAAQNAFKRLRLNIWTEQAERWLDVDVWQKGATGPGKIDEAALRGRRCFVGLDLSSTTDLTAEALLFPPDDPESEEPLESKWLVLWRFWIPRHTLDNGSRAHREAELLSNWAKAGWITLTDGNVIDYDEIRAQVKADGDVFKIAEVAFDPWNASDISVKLEGDGFTVVPVRQGFATLSEPSKKLEKMLLAAVNEKKEIAEGGSEILHGGNPVAGWMASNVAARHDPADNIKPDKAASADRIDGIVALIMAISRAMIEPIKKPSVYEKRGIIEL